MSNETKNPKLEKYPKTDLFEVVDTIGVPHPFCITEKHLAFESERMYLDKERIGRLEAKTKKPSCGVKGCKLWVHEHEQALLVKCQTDAQEPLKEYLQSIVPLCEADGFAGFTLMLAEGGKRGK